MKRVLALFLFAISSAYPAVSEVAPMPVVKPALNQPAEPVPAGSRPYEMEGRTEDRIPLFGFEDLSGWTVESLDGADAELVRTREQQMWGEYVGKLTHTGKSDASRAVLRPPKPIPITDTFDCINMWIYGNLWEWAPEPGTPFLNVSILLTDASGKEESVYLTRVRWKEWWLAHKKLDVPKTGMSFAGVEVRGMSNSEKRAIFLDSLYFYKEELKPLTFEPRPARNLTLFPGQDQGINGTGPGRLPFPTREETILPTNFEREFKNEVRETSHGCFVFTYSGKDGTVEYTYKPSKGGLGEITARMNGGTPFMPMQNGGLEFGESAKTGLLTDSSFENGELRLLFDLDGTQAEYRMRIWQKSLVLDFICRGGKATGVNLGEVSGIENPKLVLIPFLTFGGSNPRVLCFGKPDKPCFVSAWVDWYRSNGSSLWSQEWARPDSAKINGGVRYSPKTDGKLNDLYERVFLTVSPAFEETLPTIANPPTPHGQVAGERLWQESWGPENYDKEHERSAMLCSYGIEKLTQCNHEITWRDGGESFTLRTKAAPGRGGDEALKKYVAAQKSLGWLSGLYTNYTDFAPVNEHWDGDYVQRTPEGEWRPAWPRCYALKPSRAVELDAKLAPIVHEKFGSTAAYTDVQTAVAPWGYCDFDARVPGAGTFAATFYAYGELLLNDQRIYGPIWSEGTYQCFYAGLASGNYGLAYTGVDFSNEPLNVAFDLMKIHTLECDIGMPWTGFFFKEAGWEKPERIDESIDHFIAATMAYGHIGWLVEETYGIQRTCRSYYMLQALQSRYALQPPVVIRYAGPNGKWHSASKAVASDIIKLSRLNVRYENGLELYVNGSGDTWTIREDTNLPPWGWYALHTKTGFEEFSALLNGHRVDYVRSPEYEYLDGRGVERAYGGLSAKGSIAVRRKKSQIEITDIHGNDWIGFETDRRGACIAYDPAGKRLALVEVRYVQDGMAWIKSLENARTYVFTPSAQASRGDLRLDYPGAVVREERFYAMLWFTPRRNARITGTFLQVNSEPPVRIPELMPGDATGEYTAHAELHVPNDAIPGSKVWVKAWVETVSDGKPQTTEAWYVSTVVPAFEVSLQQTGDNDFTLSVRKNLQSNESSPVTLGWQPEGIFSVSPDHAQTPSIELERRSLLRIVPLGGEVREASAQLVVRIADWSWEFPIRAVTDHPVVRSFLDEDVWLAGYAFRGGPEQVGFGSTGGSFQKMGITCGGVGKSGIFSHPPYEGGVGYSYGISQTIPIPKDDCEFRAFIGIKDGGDVSDGVVFTILALDENGGEHVLVKEHWDKREWKEVTAGLTAFRGQKIRFKFITDVGPKDNSIADWASWGEPRIVLSSPVMKVAVGP